MTGTSPETSPGAHPGRRRVLRAALATGGLLVAAPSVSALAGCSALGLDTQEGPDPLEAPAQRAEADAALARSVADGHATLAVAAGAYAVDRQAHATALRAEVHRVNPEPTATASNAPPAPPPEFPDLETARNALSGAIGRAQTEAAALVPAQPGYRAALLASVAACCASHSAVLT